VYFAGKSITNTNKSTNIQKNENFFWLAYWDQENLFDEKTRDKNLLTLSFLTYSQLTTTGSYKQYNIIHFCIVKICTFYEVLKNFTKQFKMKFCKILFKSVSRNLAKFCETGKKFGLVLCFAKQRKPNFVAPLSDSLP
jgi:hypothetical protein